MSLKPPAQLVKGVLSPVKWYSEVLFGGIMALTMTGALVRDLSLRMRISRGLSLVLLFLSGYGVERYCRLRAVPVGLAMLGIGTILVAILEALGG